MEETKAKTGGQTLQELQPQELVHALRERIAAVETTRRRGEEAAVSSGAEVLDRLLAPGGFRCGTLVEWLAAGDGSGAETLALIAAREACREGGVLVVLDHARQFYPPAAIGLGIALDRLMVVQAATTADNLWALDQSLRCPAVAAALAWPEKLDGWTFRRLQLAAEESGALGLFVRSENVRGEPSWAEARLLVEPLPWEKMGTGRRLRVTIVRSHGSQAGKSVELVIDDETHLVHLAPRLAHPAADRRTAGA